MIVKRISGYDVILGEAQGYQGLPVRATNIFDPVAQVTVQLLTSQWSFTKEEREQIAAGEDIFVQLQAYVHPPIIVCVGDPNPAN